MALRAHQSLLGTAGQEERPGPPPDSIHRAPDSACLCRLARVGAESLAAGADRGRDGDMTMVRAKGPIALLPAMLLGLAAAPAYADGLGAEAHYGHAEGRDGTELGVGYALGFQGFSLTPGAGVFIRDDKTRVYGRVEAAYTLPTALSVGVGVRLQDEARPYATVAFPLLPKVAIRGNLGAHYYAIGLKVGY